MSSQAPGAEKTPEAVYCDFEEDDRFGPKHGPMFKILNKNNLKYVLKSNLREYLSLL